MPKLDELGIWNSNRSVLFGAVNIKVSAFTFVSSYSELRLNFVKCFSGRCTVGRCCRLQSVELTPDSVTKNRAAKQKSQTTKSRNRVYNGAPFHGNATTNLTFYLRSGCTTCTTEVKSWRQDFYGVLYSRFNSTSTIIPPTLS